MKYLVAMFCLFLCLSANAEFQYAEQLPSLKKGGWSSGGGNAVVCFHPEFAKEAFTKIDKDGSFPDELFSDLKYVKSIQTLDLFEARLERGAEPPTKPDIIPLKENETPEQYITRVANRFHHYVTSVENTVLQGREFLPQGNIRFYQGAVVQNRDTGHPRIINKKTCKITTIANQANQNGFYELYIDSRAYKHPAHEMISKTVLFLHEYVYASARSRGEKDSQSSRKLVEVIITRHKDFTVDYVSKLVKDLNFSFTPVVLGESHRSHIFNSYLVDAPTFWFSDVWRNLGEDVSAYVTPEIQAWMKEVVAVLAKHNILLHLGQNPTLETILWWEAFSPKLPDSDEIKAHLKKLEEFRKERRSVIFKKYYNNRLPKLKKAIDQIPALTADKDLIYEMISNSFNQLIRNMDLYIDLGDERGSTNVLLFFTTRDFKEAAPVLYKDWNQRYNFNFLIGLNNIIP